MIQEHKVETTTEIEVAKMSSKAENDPAVDSVTSELSGELDDSGELLVSAMTAAKRSSNPKSVSFAMLEIREYPIVPGDNPSVLFGCPLSIAWEYDSDVTCSIDDYEEIRPQPRAMTQMRIPSALREEKLLRVGYSRRDIQEATKQATVVRNQRRKTAETMKLAPIQYFFERAKRKTLGLVQGGAKRKERELLLQTLSASSVGKPALVRDYSLRASTGSLTQDTAPASTRSFNTINTI
jgi:hypothetical protein